MHGQELPEMIRRADEARAEYLRTGDLAAADLAVRLWDAVVGLDPAVDHRDELGGALLDRYEAGSDKDDLLRARAVHSEVVRRDRDPVFLNNLGNCLCACHRDLRLPGALGEAVEVLEEAVRRMPDDDPAFLVCQDNLAQALAERYAVLGACDDLGRALDLHENVVAMAAPEVAEFAMFHNSLGNCALEWFTLSGEVVHLFRAIAAYTTSVEHSDDGDPQLPMRLANLASALHTGYEYGDDHGPADIDKIVGLAGRAVELSPEGAADLPRQMRVLADAVWTRFEETADTADMDRAIRLYREAAGSSSGTTAAVCDHNFALACLSRYERQRRPGDLDEAVEGAERALARLPDEAPMCAQFYDTLASVLLAVHQADGGIDVLQRAVAAAEESVRRTPADHPARLSRLRHHGAVLAHRWYALGDSADLDRAGEVLETAGGLRPGAGTPDSAAAANDQGVVLRDRYNRSGDPADLEESVNRLRLAVRTGKSAQLPLYLENLGEALALRSRLTGNAADLEEGLAAYERSIALRPATGPAGVEYLAGRAGLLVDKFDRTGDLADLDEALAGYQRALAEVPVNAPGRAGLLNDRGNALRVRFEHTGADADLAEATACFRRAIELARPSAPGRAIYLDNLANCLVEQFQSNHDPVLLDVAEESFNAALALTPGSAAEHTRILANLAGARLQRWAVFGDVRELEAATSLWRDVAARAGTAQPGRVRWLNNLAAAVAIRADLDGDSAQAREVADLYREACVLGLETDPHWALKAARNWGQWAMRREDWTGAAEAHGLGRSAVRQLFTAQNDRAHKEIWLRQAPGLAADSALTGVRLGAAEDALLAVEESRARVLTEVLAQDVADPAGLASAGHEDLAARFQAAVERRTALARRRRDRREDRMAAINPFDEIRAARREFDGVVEEIRALPGYRGFQAEPTFDDVKAAAADRPLCYLTAADADGVALIVAEGEVMPIVLPGLTVETVSEVVFEHLEGARAFSRAARAADDEAAEPWVSRLNEALRRLWDIAMAPVFDAVDVPDGITLVAGGLLGLLPLHAAWYADESAITGRRHAIDLAAISYVPNARSLTVARQRALRIETDRLLAVADPQPVPEGMSSLESAWPEALAVAALAPGEPVVLAAGEATAARVCDELPSATVLHFACHGVADLLSPADSHLVLAGGTRLSLRNLLNLKIDARLAVLSACETALPGTELPDEVLGLPTGLLQAGAAGVVASGWAAHDLTTAMTITDFTRRWRAGATPAEALRQAQRWIRDSTNEEKSSALQSMAGLPAGVLEHFEDELSLRGREDRDEAGIHRWAAFQHIGV
ncbi:CHAT domain-containing protein [Amycolatopsis sp. Hca4]|uniref:CHAT domain-containing tetratricopeptide repeat protein n=1 Tax=Amycolatopsis sp. Hca4 TaxID=2742131 RepID=UPI0015908A6C|nr:CHAT domain-containing protein [Amycolatopsis sp. Hca4]QKV74886.1 CHAT domain-containing protein [Amycolatopsis sp. Hca4]